MADPIVYPWNPFQERIDCRIPGEVIKPNGVGTRVEFVPQAAPFYGNKFKLYRQGSNEELKVGIDFIFGHPFDRFIDRFKRNAFGSVILLKPVSAPLLAAYDTIGGPFILDQVAYATLVANINNSPRQADWSDITDVPYDFPADPHEQPAAQTYDYLDMVQYLKNLVLAITETGTDQINVRTILEEHLAKDLDQAHRADRTMIGLDLVENLPPAIDKDLDGNSTNKVVTVAVMKEAFRRLAAGALILEPDEATPEPPTVLKVVKTTLDGAPSYSITISGGSVKDGGPITYRLVQGGAVTVILSKTIGIGENEAVTFVIPAVSAETLLTISAVTVDSIGSISTALSTAVMLPAAAPNTAGFTYINTDAALTIAQKGVVIIDAADGNRLTTLPSSDSNLGVADFIVRRSDPSNNTLKIAAFGTDKIKFHTHLNPEGYSFLLLMGAGDYWHLRSDAAGGWIPISRYDNAPLGHLVMETTTVFNPGGYGPVSGPILQRAVLPWLWDHAQQSGMLVDESERVGMEGGWTRGDGTLTFRGPEVRAEFLRLLDEGRGVDSLRKAGSWAADAFKSHSHLSGGVAGIGQGAAGPNRVQQSDGWQSTTATGGTETRPRSIAYPGRIKMI